MPELVGGCGTRLSLPLDPLGVAERGRRIPERHSASLAPCELGGWGGGKAWVRARSGVPQRFSYSPPHRHSLLPGPTSSEAVCCVLLFSSVQYSVCHHLLVTWCDHS